MGRLLTAGIITIASVLAFLAWLIFGLLYYTLDPPLWMNVLLIPILAGIVLPVPIVFLMNIGEWIRKGK